MTEVQQYTGPEDLYGLQVSRDKEQEVWDFILTELEESALELPETRESVERTRATRYAAYALQPRAALYAASIAKYGKVQLNGIVGVNSDDANAYWAKSIEAADKVINSGKYSFTTSMRTGWRTSGICFWRKEDVRSLSSGKSFWLPI